MARVPSGWQHSLSLVELLGLTLWIGGLAVILVAVIPAVFNTFSMEQGGRFLRRVFDGYNTMTSSIVMLLLGTAGIRTWNIRNRPDHFFPVNRPEWGLLMSLVVMTGIIVFVVVPQTIELQEIAFATKSQDAKQLAYDAFFRTHMVVRALHLINGGLAISLLVVKFRQWGC